MVNITFKEEPVTLLGEEIKAGDQAPDFTVLSNDLKEVSLDDYKGKVKLISTVPSLDTGVCSQETKRFNEEADKLDNVQILTVSMDLPFAQTRWCAAEGIKNLDTLSDHREDRKSTRLNSSHVAISYAVFCLKKKNEEDRHFNRSVRPLFRTACILLVGRYYFIVDNLVTVNRAYFVRLPIIGHLSAELLQLSH